MREKRFQGRVELLNWMESGLLKRTGFEGGKSLDALMRHFEHEGCLRFVRDKGGNYVVALRFDESPEGLQQLARHLITRASSPDDPPREDDVVDRLAGMLVRPLWVGSETAASCCSMEYDERRALARELFEILADKAVLKSDPSGAFDVTRLFPHTVAPVALELVRTHEAQRYRPSSQATATEAPAL